uniref:Uncharacterized protein n=1 Tax=Glossina pallidipes TaxID=7398 RepID=A0A1B0AD44_GLOPL
MVLCESEDCADDDDDGDVLTMIQLNFTAVDVDIDVDIDVDVNADVIFREGARSSSISGQMDVPKFALDRNSYLSTAATAGSLYESSKAAQASAAYSAYLDPSVLTKAYFDSKMYQDRAANYAFDISKIYGAQQHNSSTPAPSVHQQHQQHQHFLNGLSISSPQHSNQTTSNNTNNVDERETTPHLESGGSSNGGPVGRVSDSKALLHSPNGNQMDYNPYGQYGQVGGNHVNSPSVTAGVSTSTVSSTASGDYRRPLTQ